MNALCYVVLFLLSPVSNEACENLGPQNHSYQKSKTFYWIPFEIFISETLDLRMIAQNK